MRKSVAVLLFATLLLGLAFSGEIHQTLNFDRSRLSFGEAYGYATVKFAEAPTIDGLGMPALPEMPMHYVIPPSATVTSVEVTNVVEEALPGEYNVLPGQIGRAYRDNDPVPPFVQPDPSVYNSDAVFPKSIARYQLTGNKGGFRVAGVTLYPIRYSPTTKKLYFVSRADITVNYKENSVTAARDFPRQIAEMSRDLIGIVANPQDLKHFAPASKNHGDPSPFLPAGYFEHVIVSPAIFADSFIALRDMRTLQGYPSTIMTIENICSTYPGYDTAEKIRNFLKDARATWGTIWAFLPRYDYPAAEYRPAYVSYSGTELLPCDLYFSDLDGSWDGNHNHTYGECPGDSITGYSDLYVGFIPIDNAGQVHNFLSKLWRYEQNPGANYVEKVTLPVGVTFSQNYADTIANADPANWIDHKMYYPAGSGAEWQDSINAGYGFASGIHHGAPDEIEHGSSILIDVNAALALTNQKLGVFITVACDPGGWDEVGTENGDCLAENAVVRAPNAWVAVMMNARSGWVDVAEHYNYEFMYRVLPPTVPMDSDFITVGQGLARAKDYWIPNWNLGGDSSRYRWEAYERNLFGEPAMQLWTKEPAYDAAVHSGVVTIGNNIPYQVTVNTATDAPIESAMVVLWKGSEVYTKGRTNASGQITLYVSPVTPGPMVLAVNAHNYFLHVDTVHVISTDRYVSYLRSTISDPTPGGNGDSLLNPGETVKIPTWVKNWGQQTASTVTAKLRTHDANAQVTDSSKTFGNIPAGDSATTGDNGFGLHVNSGLPNSYTVSCSLICRDALDSVWVSNVGFVVGTPVLDYQSLTIHDSTGGNGNGRIDPGEDAGFEVSIKNDGGGHGYNSSAKLRSGDSRFTILDSMSTYGLVRKGATASNIADMFQVHADAGIPKETPVTCTLLLYADGGYTHTQTFSIIVGQVTATDPIPDGPRTPALYYAYDDGDVSYPEHPTYNWIELRGRGTAISLGDDQTATIAIPALFGPFNMYGQSSSQLSICSNGWACPGTSSLTAYTNAALPSNTIAPNAICVNWDDQYPPTGGGVLWMYDTTNHALVVEWDSVSYYPSGSNYDKYEIVIYDSTVHAATTDNVIVLQYMTDNAMGSNTIGIQDPTYAIDIQCLYNGTLDRGCLPFAPHRAIKFTTTAPANGVAESNFDASALKTTRLTAYPNPLKGAGNIRWSVKSDGPVMLKVYDAGGRAVRTLVNNRQKPGNYQTTWNGRSDDGRTVSSGIYFYKLQTSTGTSQLKVVVTR